MKLHTLSFFHVLVVVAFAGACGTGVVARDGAVRVGLEHGADTIAAETAPFSR